MKEDDPRHGKESGYSAHSRDGEKPCSACWAAKLRGDKRRRVLGPALRPVPEDVFDILERYSDRTLENRTGVSICALQNMRQRGVAARAYPATIERLRAVRAPTDIGLVRRIQALARLGWSAPEIAARSGVPYTTIARLRDHEARQWLGRDCLRDALASAYDEMSMAVPPLTRHSSRIARKADAAGWPPPLAWDDIDDPNEQPSDWSYTPTPRADLLRDHIDRGDNLTLTCRALGLSANTLNSWCLNNSLGHLYRALAAREGDWNSRGRIGREGAA